MKCDSCSIPPVLVCKLARLAERGVELRNVASVLRISKYIRLVFYLWKFLYLFIFRFSLDRVPVNGVTVLVPVNNLTVRCASKQLNGTRTTVWHAILWFIDLLAARKAMQGTEGVELVLPHHCRKAVCTVRCRIVHLRAGTAAVPQKPIRRALT